MKWQVFLTQLCACLAIAFYGMGRTWIDGGEGLHPMLAGAGILLCLTLPYFWRAR